MLVDCVLDYMNNLPELSRGGSVCDDLHAFLCELQSERKPEIRPIADAYSYSESGGKRSVCFSAVFPDKLFISSCRTFGDPNGDEKTVKVRALSPSAWETLGEWIFQNRAFQGYFDSVKCVHGVLIGDELVTESFYIDLGVNRVLLGHKKKSVPEESIPEHLAIRNAIAQLLSPSPILSARIGWVHMNSM